MKREPKLLTANIITFIFIFLFVYTALNKFYDFNLFQATLAQSPLIGSYSKPISTTLPIIELTVAFSLFFPQTRKTGLCFSLILMTVFTLYIGYLLLFAHNLPCSCGGVLQKMSWQQHFWFNILLISLAALGFRFYNPGSRKQLKLLLK